MALTAAAPFDRAERLYITGGDRKVSDFNLHGYSLRVYYYRRESMSSRRKVLLKVIILGDSGSVYISLIIKCLLLRAEFIAFCH